MQSQVTQKASPRMQPDDTWFKRNFTIGNLISVAAVGFTFAGFYFTTTSTLTAQGQSISAINAERQSLRAEMTDRAEKTSAGIAELNKQTAVLSTQVMALRDELARLSAQITNIGTGNSIMRR